MFKRKTSLAEMMGSYGANKGKLTLDSLPNILGDGMPELPKTQVGRHRLVRSLQQRYGNNFRSLPGVKDLISEFDKHLDFEKKIAKMKAIRLPKRKG